MVYVGIAARTALRRVSLPALLRKRVDQLRDLCLILSTMEVNKSRFLFPKCSGRAKYFPNPPTLVIPRICCAAALTSVGDFEEKVMDDFA